MQRREVRRLQEIPNVGPAMERDFRLIGIDEPADLVGRDPYRMFEELCDITQARHDPCVIDVFLAAVRYMEGGPARKWWEFTAERKNHLHTRAAAPQSRNHEHD